MRTIKIILFIVICAFMSSVYAQFSQDITKEMTKASQEAVAGYKKHGVYGMIEKVARCYSQLSDKMLYCSYIDLASKYIELTASQARGYPPSQFFSDESFSDRTSEIFEKAGLDNGQGDILLKIISPEINKLVDIELSKSTG
ncbi:hypothetical protein [Nitrosomonas communis]|uniref:hypothetical protein n=1 Tax=Nitrosomonas communis TaxID=44574 RepID=UPI003D26E30A